jgi:hypothetical protein
VVYVRSARGALERQVQKALDLLVGEERACPEAWFSTANASDGDAVGSA